MYSRAYHVLLRQGCLSHLGRPLPQHGPIVLGWLEAAQRFDHHVVVCRLPYWNANGSTCSPKERLPPTSPNRSISMSCWRWSSGWPFEPPC